MSSTEIYGVKANGEVTEIGETKNSWRGAMHVWQTLSEKYKVVGSIFDFSALWNMADKGRLADFENIVLKSTFDNVLVKKENIPVLLEAFRKYDKQFPGSSLAEQAEVIEKAILEDDGILAVCWNQTSVNESPWYSGYDEETEERIPYNINSGDQHWWLFG